MSDETDKLLAEIIDYVQGRYDVANRAYESCSAVSARLTMAPVKNELNDLLRRLRGLKWGGSGGCPHAGG